jgi:hypothetical protein
MTHWFERKNPRLVGVFTGIRSPESFRSGE